MSAQPWLQSRAWDGAFILGPGFAVTGLVLLFPGFFTGQAMTPLLWLLLVVGVDVGHVYSTLWRTYLDPAEFRRRPTLYVLAPLLGWLAFAGLYSLGAAVFWRALAYLAVFHFVRQQYGFMMLYARHERRWRAVDKLAIYAATAYPLVWWHTHARQFDWFVPGDFVSIDLPLLSDAAGVAYAGVALLYVGKELALRRAGHAFNWPRNLLLLGTALSWWVGIVALDSDLAFTAVNVVAHGLPYVALVWLYGRRTAMASGGATLLGLARTRWFSALCLPLFVGVPLLLAYAEEGLWDGFVWADHPGLFRAFAGVPTVEDAAVLVWLIPLLALPQITHYVLDGFIWRTDGTARRATPA